MPTKNSKVKEENYHCISNNNDHKRTFDIKDNEQSGNVNWWINELDTLGINKKSNNEDNNNTSELPTSQHLEDLTDHIKQRIIRDYKVCYSR